MLLRNWTVCLLSSQGPWISDSPASTSRVLGWHWFIWCWGSKPELPTGWARLYHLSSPHPPPPRRLWISSSIKRLGGNVANTCEWNRSTRKGDRLWESNQITHPKRKRTEAMQRWGSSYEDRGKKEAERTKQSRWCLQQGEHSAWMSNSGCYVTFSHPSWKSNSGYHHTAPPKVKPNAAMSCGWQWARAVSQMGLTSNVPFCSGSLVNGEAGHLWEERSRENFPVNLKLP